ncbi:MAG: BLUF domain-containing protein [Rhodospirillales bacterium]
MLQAIYISAATRKFTANELQDLLKLARSHNHVHGISGMLVYYGGSFLQIIEGPDDEVEALIRKIKQDPRHTKFKLLFKDTIEEKEFEDWSMGFVDTTRNAKSLPGFVDYTSELQGLTIDKTRARKVLSMFHSGSWRQTVDI